MNTPQRRLIIVSNRLPIVIEPGDDGWLVRPGSGGLVTALAPVLRDRGGLWIGWPGATGGTDIEEPIREAARAMGYVLHPVHLSQHDVDLYYHGLSNEVLWPLFHDLQTRCNFRPEYWTTYTAVNRIFAEAIQRRARGDDYVWVHDYQLICVGQELRKLKARQTTGFFLHIPFPPPDIFLKCPWRNELLGALLAYDLIGFQTMRDRRNFVQCVRMLIKDAVVYGKGQVASVRIGERKIKIGHFPISIDYDYFASQSAAREVADSAWYIHEHLPEQKIILGIDRLDYTKGIPERLRAYEQALVKYPDLCGKVIFIQIVVPSRVHIPEYQQLRTEIEQMVANINGRFTKYGWVPIQYIFRSLDKYELFGYYRTAEIALITPLKDGMNLVAKEYCACSLEQNGVVILSEFAGASAQMQKGAIMVNPYDVESVADAIYQAWNMEIEERRARMNRLRQSIRRYDVFWWVDSFLQAAFTEKLQKFPILEDYDYITHTRQQQF